MIRSTRIVPAALLALPFLVACQTMEDPSVIAVTGTVIGLDISQNAGSGSPQAALGYKRAEVAIVSDNTLEQQGGGEDVANVVMELRYSNEGADAGIYQRLAVGKSAVSGPGAAIMFARNPDGTMSPEAADALSSAFSATAVTGDDDFGDD